MKKVKGFSAALIAILFFFPSCGKKSSPAPVPVCRLSTVLNTIGGSVTTYNLSYGDNGKLSMLVTTDAFSTITKVFSYTGNVIIVNTSTTISNSTTTKRDSIVVNSDGLMQSDLLQDGASKTLTSYVYSGTQLQKIITQQDTDPATTDTYTYANGDLVISSDGSEYTYNTAKATAMGDLFQITQLLNNGVPSIKNAHQLVSSSKGGSEADVAYSYDVTGKITKMTITAGTSVQAFDYIYDCN